jgi:hypothetical protein
MNSTTCTREERAKLLFVKLFNHGVFNDEEYHSVRHLLLGTFVEENSLDDQVWLLETIIEQLQQKQTMRKTLEQRNKELKEKLINSRQLSPTTHSILMRRNSEHEENGLQRRSTSPLTGRNFRNGSLPRTLSYGTSSNRGSSYNDNRQTDISNSNFWQPDDDVIF